MYICVYPPSISRFEIEPVKIIHWVRCHASLTAWLKSCIVPFCLATMAISHIGTNILILTIIFYALDVLAVILRIYSRHLKSRALGLDDYAAIIALVSKHPCRCNSWRSELRGGTRLPRLETW